MKSEWTNRTEIVHDDEQDVHTSIAPNGVERKRKYRALPPLAILPTLLTLGNLVAGFAAIYYASRDDEFLRLPWGWSALTFAGTLIFVGMLLDAVDGSVARLTRSFSDIGAQLDSFADVITFGVAPAFLALTLVGTYFRDAGVTIIGPEADHGLGRIVWAIAAIYVSCAALRLARYNVEASAEQHSDSRSFRGLPSPGAAGAVVSLIILHQHILMQKYFGEVDPGLARWSSLGIPAIMLLCAMGMVSRIRYVHFANNFLRGTKSFTGMVRVVVPLLLAIWWPQEVLAIAFTAYILSGPVLAVWSWVRRRFGFNKTERAATDKDAK